MRKDIGWAERVEDGVKREVRVIFDGGGKIRWDAWRSDTDRWRRNIPPSLDDWDMLVKKVAARYNRRMAPYKDMELVRRLAEEARAKAGPDQPA